MSIRAHRGPQALADVAPDLQQILTRPVEAPGRFARLDIRRVTVWVTMRDGVRLATDLYLPPEVPSPAIAVRTPYGRANPKLVEPFIAQAQHGYIIVAQDCRGTGDSEPDSWDYYVYEREDSFDLVEWVTRQDWFNGFLGGCGGSYLGATQWCMAMHPHMSTIVPEVCGLGIVARTARNHMFLHAYARSVGKGADKSPLGYDELERQTSKETLASGYYNEPLNRPFSRALLDSYPVLRSLPPAEGKQWLWDYYSGIGGAQRARLIKEALDCNAITVVDVETLTEVFGHQIAHDAHLLPSRRRAEVLRSLHAPALMITGWYDWYLDDALATWELLRREAPEPVSSRSRLIIAPSAHLMPGYHEGREGHPELERVYRTQHIVDLLLRWYATVREGTCDSWPVVTYYLMGANEWCLASAWPPPEARTIQYYLGEGGTLGTKPPRGPLEPDHYIYDARDPTPTVGGSIISFVYPAGGVDVSAVQRRSDVLTYTTPPLQQDVDVVGPLRMILYASSSAVDTDFAARLSDVFPDGRAIQLQSGLLRARYRTLDGEPELLEPGRIYRFEIDMWATANRFKAGHRIRVDIASADFPRFDRNSNRGGEPGDPTPARQRIYHDPEQPSHLLLSVLGDCSMTGWA
jgi:predicted acyl esterase